MEGGQSIFCCVLMTFAVCHMVGLSDIIFLIHAIRVVPCFCRWGCCGDRPPWMLPHPVWLRQ